MMTLTDKLPGKKVEQKKKKFFKFLEIEKKKIPNFLGFFSVDGVIQ